MTFLLHYKDTDKAGEDGDFKKKVDRIEHLDQFIPQVLALRPDVLLSLETTLLPPFCNSPFLASFASSPLL